VSNPISRAVGRIPGIGLVQVVPNTATFAVRSWRRARRVPMYPDIPAAKPSPWLLAQVALDETFLGAMRSPGSHPHRADYVRVGAELRDALALYEDNGWVDDPLRYHRSPPPIGPVTREPGSSRGVAYEHLSWESGYRPHDGEPGAERWSSRAANLTAHANVVRSATPSSTWLVCIHGFGMGSPLTDFHAFRARKLAEELSVNLVFPVLPMHGPRKASFMSGADFLSFELMNPVFGVTQAAWDVRGLLSWLEAEEGAASFGLYGISLGGYTSAVLAGLDDRFELVIAGIPATGFPKLMRHHSPPAMRRRALEHGLLGETADKVHRVISPLAITPMVAKPRRFIYGALGDRMSTPAQAHDLWNHWDRPRIEWVQGAHAASILNAVVDEFVSESLVRSGFASAPEPVAFDA
jgi:hypothetical protein